MDPWLLVLGLVGVGATGIAVAAQVRHARLRTALDGLVADFDPAGRADRPVASLRSVVEDREARLVRLSRATEVLESGTDGAPFGVVLCDGAGEIVHLNAAARSLMEGSHGTAAAKVHAAVEEVLATGHPVSATVELFRPERRHVGITARPLDGDHAAVAVYVEDSTDRVRIDEVRRDFVANASHELKTPLGALSVLAESLRDAADPAVRDRLTRRMQDQAGRMARLVDDILDLSLVESDTAEFAPVSIDEVVAEATARVATTAVACGIDVNVQASATDPKVVGDARQLVSAVANLLDNAVKFTAAAERPGGGAVSVRTIEDGGSIVVEVVDDGIGIPSGHVDRIFERFYRVDRARSRETGGTGLGLAIVRHVALNHGGSVSVASTPGEGATFRLVIPRER